MNQLIVAYLLSLEKKRKINWLKHGFVRDYFQSGLGYVNREDVGAFITENKTFRAPFCRTVPYLFMAFIELTNLKNRNNEKCFAACELYDLYKNVGKYYLECDGTIIDNDTIERYISYLDILELAMIDTLDDNIYDTYKKECVDDGLQKN